MGMFFSELGFVVAVLACAGVSGGWVILPFRRRLPYGALAAPLAGLLMVLLGTAVL